MLDDVTLASFTPHVGQPFDVLLPDGTRLALTLTEAAPAPGHDDPRRARPPFSLIFRPTGPLMPRQGTYVIEREGFGAAEIFLVPVQPDHEGARLQAIYG